MVALSEPRVASTFRNYLSLFAIVSAEMEEPTAIGPALLVLVQVPRLVPECQDLAAAGDKLDTAAPFHALPRAKLDKDDRSKGQPWALAQQAWEPGRETWEETMELFSKPSIFTPNSAATSPPFGFASQ